MSQENVELVHRAYDALHRKDLDAFVELHDPECEIRPRAADVEGGPDHGHDGVRAYWRDMHAAFTDWVVEIEETRDFADTVIVKARFHARGRDSGAVLDQPLWQSIKFRDGRGTWWAVYGGEAEALEAAGLRE